VVGVGNIINGVDCYILLDLVGVGKLINSVDVYILLDLVGVGDWKVPTVFPIGSLVDMQV
jgi:hypothetical protein